jgi:ABC-type molybdate transport system permease subunit
MFAGSRQGLTQTLSLAIDEAFDVDVRVRVGPLVAEITGASAQRLGLREGEIVVVSFTAAGARLLRG